MDRTDEGRGVMFFTGQKVVRVNGGHWELIEGEITPDDVLPKRDIVYTIFKIHHHDDGDYLALCEIDGSIFDARGFRPVVERTTDISVFTALLNTTKVPENA